VSKNCVLVGGSGFLGMNLARELLSAGYNVTIADTSPLLSHGFSDMAKGVNFCQIDFRDHEKMQAVLKKQEILFHLACSSLPSTSVAEMENDIKDNVVGSIELFRIAAKNGVKKIIFPSSGGTVYGNADSVPISEKFPTNPICSYGITKLTTEKYLIYFNKIFGVDYLIYRISNLYGPGQNPSGIQGLIPCVINRMLKGMPINIFGDGKNIRDYIYVRDAVEAFVLGMKMDLKNDVFNVGTGKGYTINQIIEITSRITGVKPAVAYSEKRPIDVKANVLNSQKIESLTGWKANIPIEKGIADTFSWVKGLIDTK